MDAEELASIEAEMTSGERLDDDHYWRPTILKDDGRIFIYDTFAHAEADGGGTFIGLHENHRSIDSPTGWCGGWVGFKNIEGHDPGALHTLISRDPLTVSASLGCRRCPSHGFIQNGQWVAA